MNEHARLRERSVQATAGLAKFIVQLNVLRFFTFRYVEVTKTDIIRFQ